MFHLLGIFSRKDSWPQRAPRRSLEQIGIEDRILESSFCYVIYVITWMDGPDGSSGLKRFETLFLSFLGPGSGQGGIPETRPALNKTCFFRVRHGSATVNSPFRLADPKVWEWKEEKAVPS